MSFPLKSYSNSLLLIVLFISLYLSDNSFGGKNPPPVDRSSLASPIGPTAISDQRQLFTDRERIDRMENVTLKLHEPIPREIIFYFDQPWEGIASYYPVVFKDENRYRMWYQGMDEDEKGKNSNGVTAYAESSDGIRWSKPNLGLIEFNESKENNICMVDLPGAMIFRDTNPAAPDNQRYKAVSEGTEQPTAPNDKPNKSLAKPPKRPACLYGATSPDGLHWTKIPNPILIADEKDPALDTHPSAFWDPILKKYVMYQRGWHPDPEINGWATDKDVWKKRIRAIRMATSDDFIHWSDWQYVDIGEKPWSEHLYTNSAHLYYRAPLYLMFPKRFEPKRKFFPDFPTKGQSDVVFLTSHDGLHWSRTFHEAFLRPGLDPKNWHDRTIYIARDVVPTAPGEMSLYIMQNYRTKNVHIRRFTLREDGFASANATVPAGTLTTKPLTFTGNHLEINYSTSGAGHIRVEILAADGSALQEFSMGNSEVIFGDEISREVVWKNKPDLGALQNASIRLRFELLDADIYSFRFYTKE